MTSNQIQMKRVELLICTERYEKMVSDRVCCVQDERDDAYFNFAKQILAYHLLIPMRIAVQ